MKKKVIALFRKSWLPLLLAVLVLIGLTAWENEIPWLSDPSHDTPSAVSVPTNSNVQSNITGSESGAEYADGTTIKLSLLGDIMCHPTQYEAAKINNAYDFSPCFEDIQSDIADADLTLANLETTLAGKEMTYSGYPSFNTPEQLAYALKKTLGVDVVSTANNHALDRMYSGLCHTIDFLDACGLKHTGTYKTQEESTKILIENVSGVKIAFLSYTYGTNGITLSHDKDFAVNYLDRDKIKQDAQNARDAGAAIIIASLHWGTEYAEKPSAEQTALSRWVFENTEVDIISGNHAHAVEPIEFINVVHHSTQKDKEGLVIYAQGNFISDQKTDSANMGIAVNIIVENHPDDKPTIAYVEYFPTWIDETAGAGLRSYRVLNVEKALEAYCSGKDPLLSEADYQEMLSHAINIKKIIPANDRIRYTVK
ncbi:CapA family protein [Dehalobacter sp. DCM]|uniref:CapA family protein n=1 Tax=Dehalobacter sp. DCM TaxID=2907827 RepID=UPI003081CE59|nr:CapA family protein [Dehalobacter sp. DCM]